MGSKISKQSRAPKPHTNMSLCKHCIQGTLIVDRSSQSLIVNRRTPRGRASGYVLIFLFAMSHVLMSPQENLRKSVESLATSPLLPSTTRRTKSSSSYRTSSVSSSLTPGYVHSNMSPTLLNHYIQQLLADDFALNGFKVCTLSTCSQSKNLMLLYRSSRSITSTGTPFPLMP
jgi:hypothetical protein